MNRIDHSFASGRKLFIPYITAGFPSVAATVPIMHALVANGADIIELGYPFSDPTADGPVIQASSQAALEGGFRRDDYFAMLRSFRERDTTTPVVIFSYFNPIFHLGVDRFAEQAAAAGADGMLIVDVPYEEQEEVLPSLKKHGLHLIQLIAPTTPPERARRIVGRAGGFVYQIARRGVTGVRSELTDDLAENARQLKALTTVPVALGFGVSTAAQAATVARYTDAVVVGSAIVKVIADHLPAYQAAMAELVSALAAATHGDG